MSDGPPFRDEDLIPVSALQHLVYCERQFALIHVEELWAENRYTVEGQQLHERVDSGKPERRLGVILLRCVPLRSERLGLVGRADLVEQHDDGTVCPIEYKRGEPKRSACDRVQLCAQAICLEEAFGKSIGHGCLYYGKLRRRVVVACDAPLRQVTETAVARAREVLRSRRTPRAHREPKCDACSLLDLCLPEAMRAHSARREFMRMAEAALGAEL